MSDKLTALIQSLIWAVPYAIAYATGAIMALNSWSKHPRVSMLALSGFAILLGNVILHVGVLIYLQSSGPGPIPIFKIVRVVQTLAGVTGIGLVIAAVFIERRPFWDDDFERE